jgi:Tol biopolymer transport system component
LHRCRVLRGRRHEPLGFARGVNDLQETTVEPDTQGVPPKLSNKLGKAVAIGLPFAVVAMFAGTGAVAGSSSATGSAQERILFLRGGLCCGDLLAIDPTVGVVRRLTRGYRDAVPQWSPDGSRIAFERADGAIYIINADGSHLRRVASGNHPTWSPDGRRLAFTRGSQATFTGGVFVIDTNGRHLHEIVKRFRVSGAEWSPDGQRIAYDAEQPDIWNEIRIVNQDGSGDRRLVGGLRDNAVRPVWSPDGSTVACVRFIGGGSTSRIHLIKADGTNDRGLTDETSPSVDEQDPSWSPDGRQIAFVRDVSGRVLLSEVDLINADGTNQRTLVRQTQGGWGWAPSWSPDGRRLAFISRRDKNLELYVVNADGTQLRRLTHTRVLELNPHWQPRR